MKKLALSLLLIPFIALAHHGLAEFDQTSKVTLKGKVTEFHFTNPHCVVEFDVDGKVWQAEMTSPMHLKGWSATSLEPGIEVTVTGWPAKTGARYLWITTLVSSNGKELGTGSKNSLPNVQ